MIQIFFGSTPIPYTCLKFSGGEVQVRITDPSQLYANSKERLKIRADLWSSDDIMELVMLVNAVREHFDYCRAIDLVCPYLPYARQDRVCYPGEAFALKEMLLLLQRLDFDNIEFWDVHNPYAVNEILGDQGWGNRAAWRFMHKLELAEAPVVVAPDKGARGRAEQCANTLRAPIIFADKKRDPNDGKILGMEITDTIFYPADKDFLIVDDICDGGRTFIELAKVLRPLTTGKILLYVTHGIFSQGFAPLMPHIDHIYTPNPFRLPHPPEVPTNYLTKL